jgi:hypothetical protein
VRTQVLGSPQLSCACRASDVVVRRTIEDSLQQFETTRVTWPTRQNTFGNLKGTIGRAKLQPPGSDVRFDFRSLGIDEGLQTTG